MVQKFNQLKVKIEQHPCPICGSREYEWGYVGDSFYQRGFFTGRRYVLSSRKCQQCGNLQIFADEDKTRKANRLGCLIVTLILSGTLLFIAYISMQAGA